jgi:hypothetical protein
MIKYAWVLPYVLAVVLAGCGIQPVTQVVTPQQAYGRNPDPELACRLLRAARCAYSIVDTGHFDHNDPNYSVCSDGALDLRPITDKNQHLNAVLAKLTSDAVIIAYRGTLPFVNNG